MLSYVFLSVSLLSLLTQGLSPVYTGHIRVLPVYTEKEASGRSRIEIVSGGFVWTDDLMRTTPPFLHPLFVMTLRTQTQSMAWIIPCLLLDDFVNGSSTSPLSTYSAVADNRIPCLCHGNRHYNIINKMLTRLSFGARNSLDRCD